jgi:transcriptional regulator with XRE-family HTH domain
MTNYAEMIRSNIRAERARKRLDQADITAGMRTLGFANWHRGILGKIERGERRLLAEELLGLADVLDIPAERLISRS